MRGKSILLLTLATACLITFSAARQDSFSLSGVVVQAETELPLSDVPVTLAPGSHATRTDPNGRFVFEGLKPGRYTIVPLQSGWVVSPEDRPLGSNLKVDVVARNIVNVILKMDREAVISGRAIFTDGSPIAGTAMATVFMPTFDEFGRRLLGWIPVSYGQAGSFLQTNDRGEFRLYGLQRGDYFLGVRNGVSAVYYPGTVREVEARTISVSPGDDKDIGSLVLDRRELPTVLVEFVGPPGISFTNATVIVDGERSISPLARDGLRASIHLAPGKHELFIRAVSSSGDSYYGSVNFEMGNTDVMQRVPVRIGARVTAKIRPQEGAPQPDLSGVRCVLRDPQSWVLNRQARCLGHTVNPGRYVLEVENLPPGMYISSARMGDRDVLQNGIEILNDTEIEIVIGTVGGKVTGKALRNGLPDPGSIVVLVPNAPLRQAGPLYRSVAVDADGEFEISGIRPGMYQLFALRYLQGAPYRNEEFITTLEGKGVPVQILDGAVLARDLSVD